MPLGIAVDNQYEIEGRNKGFFDIIRVEQGSNAEKVGIQVGDTLRACNSVMDKKVIEFSSVSTALSEFIISKASSLKNNDVKVVNPVSKTRTFFMADGRKYDAVRNAIDSNLKDGSVNLVLERRNPKSVVMKAAATDVDET